MIKKIGRGKTREERNRGAEGEGSDQKIGRGKTREERNRGAEGGGSDQKNREREDQRGEKQRSRGRRN